MLSTQRGLLEGVSDLIAGIAVTRGNGEIELQVFCTGALSEEEQEALHYAAGMVAGDFPDDQVGLTLLDAPERALRSNGHFVFVRFGFEYFSEADK